MTDKTVSEKDANEMQKIREMLEESERQALDIIETKYPKHIAREFVVPLRVGIKLPDNSLFDGQIANSVTVRRQNRLERRNSNIDAVNAAGNYSKNDVMLNKMMNLITNIAVIDENGSTTASYEWGDIPKNQRTDIINELDVIDEDEIIEGMTALEFGYGNFKDFYASTAFKKLKEQQEQSFLGDGEQI